MSRIWNGSDKGQHEMRVARVLSDEGGTQLDGRHGPSGVSRETRTPGGSAHAFGVCLDRMTRKCGTEAFALP